MRKQIIRQTKNVNLVSVKFNTKARCLQRRKSPSICYSC